MRAAEAFWGEHEAAMMQILPLKASVWTCNFTNCISQMKRLHRRIQGWPKEY